MTAHIINLSERRAQRIAARHTLATVGASLNEIATTRRELPSEATLRALQAEYEEERRITERLLLTMIGEP
jgi:hypothetical protein